MQRRDFLGCISAWLGAPLATVFARDGGSQLRLSTFCSDVTPPLGSTFYPSYKPLATIEHPLLAKGVVIDDGKRRYVLCAVDWCELCNSGHMMFRNKLAKAVGTDVSFVAVQTLHQHTAPFGDLDAVKLLEQLENTSPHLDPEFFDEVTDRLAAAAKQSIDKLQPFDQIGTSQAKVDRVASSRRIITADGKFHTRLSHTKGRPELRELPEGLIDPMLKTITFAQGDKPLVRMHYYATHPQSFYGDPRASYDFPGIAREKLQEKEGVFQIYFTGCAGDIAVGKYNDRSPRARDELTERLFAGMEASVASTQLEPAGRPQWRTTPLLLTPRTKGRFSVANSRATMEDTKKSPVARMYWGAMHLAFHQRSKRPIELSSLQIGNVYILHLPGEPMIEFQLFAQRSMPDSFVAVAGYGDCDPYYICTKKAFSEGGYEPGDSLTTPDSEATLKVAIRQLLAAPMTGLSKEKAEEGFVNLFDGKTLNGWQGKTEDFYAKDGKLICIEQKTKHGAGDLFTTKQYSDFVLRLEYNIRPGGNNGIGLRAPIIPGQRVSKVGMEIQILDNSAPKHKNVSPGQYNGSLYGVVPAKRGHEKPPGQWNSMEIFCKGPCVNVTLNDVVVVDADLEKIGDVTNRPGLKHKKGHIGLLGHGEYTEFRNIRIKEFGCK